MSLWFVFTLALLQACSLLTRFTLMKDLPMRACVYLLEIFPGVILMYFDNSCTMAKSLSL